MTDYVDLPQDVKDQYVKASDLLGFAIVTPTVDTWTVDVEAILSEPAVHSDCVKVKGKSETGIGLLTVTHGAIAGGDGKFAVGNCINGKTSGTMARIKRIIDATRLVAQLDDPLTAFTALETIEEIPLGGPPTGDEASHVYDGAGVLSWRFYSEPLP